MLPETETRTLHRPSAKTIRDTKLEMWAEWERRYGQPGVVSVRRGFDVMTDAAFATITVRSAIPLSMKWNGGAQ